VSSANTVWIKALILKLENYGIKGKLLFWLKSYLSRRKLRVVIKDAILSTGELTFKHQNPVKPYFHLLN
jgi:hypothetical protein